MRKPQNRNSPIDTTRMSRWTSSFSGYRQDVTSERIESWLDQFEKTDKDTAVRVLDCVDFIAHEGIESAFSTALTNLPGWDRAETSRTGKWRFVAYSTSAGESGDTMLHRFRRVNGLGRNTYSPLFVHMSQLLSEDLNTEDTVVFVDDFSGSGTQVCRFWPELQELLPGNPTTYLVLVAASTEAINRIQTETSLKLHFKIQLDEEDNIFSTKCKYFNEFEQETLLKYCMVADKNRPKGFSDCGLVIVFAHDCPNNSIPILHKNHYRWEGLFARLV